MAKTRRKKSTPWFEVGKNDPEGLGVWLRRFLDNLRMRNFSDRTVDHRERDIGGFIVWLSERSIDRIGDVTKPIIERFQRHLFLARKKSGKPLTFRSQHGRLVAVRLFFRWLSRTNVILANPASDIELPKLERRIPGAILNELEIEKILLQPDLTDAMGMRDRTMMEVFYSTGIRRTELANLMLNDIDSNRGTLFVRQGKGKRDRFVPIGERALDSVQRYLDGVRPNLVLAPDDQRLFVSMTGDPMVPDRLSRIVRAYFDAAGITKVGSCHLFRHAMATAMLDNGADIRHIQEMLGHAQLSTTEIYTRVSIAVLQRVHAATHPASITVRPKAPPALVEPSPTREELLLALAAEVSEEADDQE